MSKTIVFLSKVKIKSKSVAKMNTCSLNVSVPNIVVFSFFFPPSEASVHFSDIAVLLFFVLLPSSLIALVLLARMLCPCCSPRVKSSHLGHHSPIEVTDGEEMLPYRSQIRLYPFISWPRQHIECHKTQMKGINEY